MMKNLSSVSLAESTFVVENNSLHRLNWSALSLLLLSVAGITGNALVCIAVKVQRRLQNVTNYFLVSLAVTDLLVSLVVIPCCVLQEFFGEWTLGLWVCDAWQVVDVMLCTSSIWHMCTISIDRYSGIRNPLRAAVGTRSQRVVGMKIAAVYLLSFAIASPLIFFGILRPEQILLDVTVTDNSLWLSSDSAGTAATVPPNVVHQLRCAVSNRQFLVYGSIVAFFVPLAVMLIAVTLSVRLLAASGSEKQARWLAVADQPRVAVAIATVAAAAVGSPSTSTSALPSTATRNPSISDVANRPAALPVAPVNSSVNVDELRATTENGPNSTDSDVGNLTNHVIKSNVVETFVNVELTDELCLTKAALPTAPGSPFDSKAGKDCSGDNSGGRDDKCSENERQTHSRVERNRSSDALIDLTSDGDNGRAASGLRSNSYVTACSEFGFVTPNSRTFSVNSDSENSLDVTSGSRCNISAKADNRRRWPRGGGRWRKFCNCTTGSTSVTNGNRKYFNGTVKISRRSTSSCYNRMSTYCDDEQIAVNDHRKQSSTSFMARGENHEIKASKVRNPDQECQSQVQDNATVCNGGSRIKIDRERLTNVSDCRPQIIMNCRDLLPGSKQNGELFGLPQGNQNYCCRSNSNQTTISTIPTPTSDVVCRLSPTGSDQDDASNVVSFEVQHAGKWLSAPQPALRPGTIPVGSRSPHRFRSLVRKHRTSIRRAAAASASSPMSFQTATTPSQSQLQLRRVVAPMSGSISTRYCGGGGGASGGSAASVRAERKAARVLGTVFTVFVVCWTPFFVVNLAVGVGFGGDVLPSAATDSLPSSELIAATSRDLTGRGNTSSSTNSGGSTERLLTVCQWLGYVSSTLNPVIYTAFNRTFRRTFADLVLRCRCSTAAYRAIDRRSATVKAAGAARRLITATARVTVQVDLSAVE